MMGKFRRKKEEGKQALGDDRKAAVMMIERLMKSCLNKIYIHLFIAAHLTNCCERLRRKLKE